MEEDVRLPPDVLLLDNSNEALAAILRPRRAGSNTVADRIDVLDQALAQIPDYMRHGVPILVRTDTAGCTKAVLTHIGGLWDTGCDVRFRSTAGPVRHGRRVLPVATSGTAKRRWCRTRM